MGALQEASGKLLEVYPTIQTVMKKMEAGIKWPGVLEAFRSFLPITANTPKLTLYEGNTPLIYAPKLSRKVGAEVFLKVEGMNPTGSFKDRGMVLAVAKAVEEGKRIILCASTGNTSASASAYAARAGLPCVVVIPAGNVALGKLSQALIHGAKVIPIPGNFDEALIRVRELSRKPEVALVNSINPYRLEGQKTAAFEVTEELGEPPDYLVLPVGNAGNITAYWKGFRELAGRLNSKLPVLFGIQAEGSAPLVRGEPVREPKTVATAIRIGNPANWEGANNAIRESKGRAFAVSDEQILESYRILAEEEGIFSEPASAASVAGLLAISRNREKTFSSRDKIACVLTGNGLKDPNTALSFFPENALQPIQNLEEVIVGEK